MKKIFTLFSLVVSVAAASAQCSDVFISEYVEGAGNDKAIELYNATASPIDLGAGQYKMGRDRDGAGNPMLLNITGVIPAYGVRVFVLDKRDPNGTGNETPVTAALQAKADTFLNPVYVQSNSPMYFNGDDAFVLVKGTATILDIVGKIGEDPGFGWIVPGDPSGREWTENHTLIRKYNIEQGVTTNPTVFDPSLEWDSLPVGTYDSLGVHRCACGTVSVDELLNRTAFDLFPNPVTDGLFALRGSKDMESFTIFSSNGAILHRENLSRVTYKNIALPQAAPGVYVIEIMYTDGSRSHRKLIFK